MLLEKESKATSRTTRSLHTGAWSLTTSVALRVALGGPLTLALLGACGSTDPARPTGDAPAGAQAVDGFRKTCEARKAWEHRIRKVCTVCLAKSSTPKCSSCGAKEYSGACSEQAKARRAEPTCEGIEKCLYLCPAGDCDCEDKCFEGKPVCQGLSATLDACTTKTCDEHCR
jgi:hypothetical protein